MGEEDDEFAVDQVKGPCMLIVKGLYMNMTIVLVRNTFLHPLL